MARSGLKTKELREKSSADLLKQLAELREELAQLRVAKATGGAAAKLLKIKVLTVYTQIERAAAQKKWAGKSKKPLDLRRKMARSQRRALSKVQARKVTRRESVRASNFPKRRYVVQA